MPKHQLVRSARQLHLTVITDPSAGRYQEATLTDNKRHTFAKDNYTLVTGMLNNFYSKYTSMLTR